MLSIIVALLLTALATNAAQSHAHLDHASPPIDGSVAVAPQDVSLFFTQNLEAAFSTVEVTDSGGARVDEGKAQISGNTMRIGLKPLAPGSYKVHWHAVSADTHTTDGSFTFRVGSQ